MTLPDKLTAEEFARLKAQEQRMLDSGSWVQRPEDAYAAEANAAAADAAAPQTMTAEAADKAMADQSVMAETQFGRAMGAAPDYSSGPAVNPADDEPKTIAQLRQKQSELINDPSYDMPFDEWKDYKEWDSQNRGAVEGFFSGLADAPGGLYGLGKGMLAERGQQLARMTVDPIGAATTEVATFKEMGRKIGVGLTQLFDWAGSKVNDVVESGRRVGEKQANIVSTLRANGQLTGDPAQDNDTIQKAITEAGQQGYFNDTENEQAQDAETGYQRYLRQQSYNREYSGLTKFSIGGNQATQPDVKQTATNPLTGQVEQPQEATSTVGAIAASPENFVPIGVGVLSKARMLRRFASITGVPLKMTEAGTAAIEGGLMRGADWATSKLPFVGDLPLKQRAYALAGAGAVGGYLDSQTDSPIVDIIAKPLIAAGMIIPAAKGMGLTLRRTVGAPAGAGWQIVKEMKAGGIGSARAETAAAMAASGRFPEQFARHMGQGAEAGVESTLRRVSMNPDMPETLRMVARSADRIGVTQVARGVDDVVSSAAVAGIASIPFAAIAPDSKQAGSTVGGALMLGGVLGGVGRTLGRRSARADADIARMMVDVEMSGGDAASLQSMPYAQLDRMAAMQGMVSGKVSVVPLRAQEYRANVDVRNNGHESVAGLHLEKMDDGTAKLYVNMGHTAPKAGVVSVKPIQISRNGKTESASVVRIKAADGTSDYTVVPRENPLLVRSGDVVAENAHIARGMSPDKILPHEIGHAILTSSVLDGTIRDDLRNIVNQQYGSDGVEARGREYVTRLVDRDIIAGAHDQLPEKLTQEEFNDITTGKRTMADVIKGKPLNDAQRTKLIDDRVAEMRERSIADGGNPDGLDIFRDEVTAETFSSLSNNIDFRAMRTGGPQVMESVLGATARVFETLGARFNRSTGKLLDNPSVIFRDNPLMDSPVMRKRLNEQTRNYNEWMVGMEQAGARERRGTPISVDGTASSASRSTHTKLRPNDNGILENDLIFVDQNGVAQWKPQGMLDQQERGRSAQVGQLYDKNKVLPANSKEFGLRRIGGGRTIISGPTLPAKFDVLRWFPKHVREFARMLEAGREGGSSHIFDYNRIGTGESGRYRVINRGDVNAIMREAAFLGWEATKAGHLKAVVMDINAFRAAAMKAINRGELDMFNNDMTQLQSDLMVYLSNHKNGLPGEAGIGQQKRDMLNGLIGTGTAVQRDVNPLYTDLNHRGSVRSFRVDRVNDITPTGRDGYHFDYDKIKNNRMPQAIPQGSQAMPDVGRQRAIKIRDEYDIRSYFLGDERPSGNDRLRSYEAGDLEYLEQSAGSGSRYVYLSDTKTGEKLTIRISDHFAPGGGGYRTDMFGGSGRSERPDYNIVNRKIYEPTNEPYTNGFKRITPQQFREEMAGWREAFQKANPAIADGAAGIKTTADKSGMPAEQAGSGSSLTIANQAQPAANVNRQPSAAPRGQAMPDVAPSGDQGVAMPKGTVTQLTNTARKALPKMPNGASSVPKLVIQREGKADIVVDGGDPKGWKDYTGKHWMPLPNIKLNKVKGVSFSKQDIYDVAQTDRARAQADAQQSVRAAALAAADPMKFVDPVGYSEIMRASGVVGDILIPPSGLKLMLTDPAAFVGLLDGGFHGKRTVPGTRAAAIQGLDGVTDMRQLVGGQPSQFNTALHHYWGTLSKQLDVVNQEAAWMRTVLDPAIIEAIDMSVQGTFNMTPKAWEALVAKALDGTKGDFRGKGNNAKANANSFYKALAYHNGRWDEVAALYANNNAIDMRAQFNALGHGKVGMKNKVQGFVGLSFGVKGSVLDRWRFVDLYLPDVMKLTGAATPEQYFKYVGAQKVIPQDPIGIYKNYGTLENGNPAFSLALYNSLDSVAQVAINNSPELRNYLGAHADPGGLHWATWNAIKNEAVGHSSLDITKNFVRKYGRNGTASDFAQFMRTAEGFVEGSNDAGQTIRLSLKNGAFNYLEQ